MAADTVERRTAIVTGGGLGAGRAIVRGLGAAGCNVVALGRTLSTLEESVAPLGRRGKAIVADLTDPDDVRRAFTETETSFGGIDILVNNAATYDLFLLEEASDAQIRGQIGIALTAPAYCMREAIPRMRARGGGDIVNISSQSAEMPQPFLTVYSGAKAGLEVLSRGLRHELKGEPFRIIVIQVGAIAGAFEREWPGDTLSRLRTAFAKSGVGPHHDSPGLPPEQIAATVVHAVTAPLTTCNQVIEMREHY